MQGDASKATSGQVARMRLIDIYSQNLAQYHTFERRTVACPLCRRAMEFDAPAEIEQFFSRAHINPQALGGKRFTLACRECNSHVGRKYEAALKHDDEWDRWSRGEASRRARMKIAGKVLAVDFRRKGKGYELAILPGLHAPGALDAARTHLASGGGLFDLDIVSPNPERVGLALLHAAFLSAFEVFGYEYALSPGGNRVRDALTKSILNETVFTKAIVGVRTTEPSAGYPSTDEFSLVRANDAFKGFLFRVTDKGSHRRFVILPAFDESDWEAYQAFLSPQQTSFKMVLRAYRIPPAAFLADSNSRFWGHQLLRSWQPSDA
jgi:hypothetical protein